LDFYDKVDFSWMGNRYQVIKTSINVDACDMWEHLLSL
jgi:hypothetical protein